MMTTLLPETLNAMWQSGFCDETLRQAAGTANGVAGRASRLSWGVQHIPHCDDCNRANKMKNLEDRVAARIGRQDDFNAGRDFTSAPGYAGALDKVLDAAVARGYLKPDDMAWIARMATRHGKPWPGHEV